MPTEDSRLVCRTLDKLAAEPTGQFPFRGVEYLRVTTLEGRVSDLEAVVYDTEGE